MVWRNTTKWLLDLKDQQQDTIIFGLVARANGTRVNGDPTVSFNLIPGSTCMPNPQTRPKEMGWYVVDSKCY